MYYLNYHQLSLIRQTNDGLALPKQALTMCSLTKTQTTIDLCAANTLVSMHENSTNCSVHLLDRSPIMQPIISIIIPQYKTFQVTRLCLRALKKFSTLNIEVIVVDNHSADDSLEYLEKNKWIKLIKNEHAAIGGQGHKQALDIGIKAAKGEWVLLFHSDTIVLKQGWDADLLNLVQQYPQAVGATSVVRDINPFASWHSRLVRRFKEKQYAYHHTLNIKQ